MFKATAAEVELDSRARKRMRKTGQSYPQDCNSELEADPSLYDKYLMQAASGTTYDAPDYLDITGSNSDSILNKARQLDVDDEDDDFDDFDDDDMEKCATCEKRMRKSDKFCPSCGKPKRKGGVRV